LAPDRANNRIAPVNGDRANQETRARESRPELAAALADLEGENEKEREMRTITVQYLWYGELVSEEITEMKIWEDFFDAAIYLEEQAELQAIGEPEAESCYQINKERLMQWYPKEVIEEYEDAVVSLHNLGA